MEKDAHIMGHSVETQQKVYVKEKGADEPMTENDDYQPNPYDNDDLEVENPYD